MIAWQYTHSFSSRNAQAGNAISSYNSKPWVSRFTIRKSLSPFDLAPRPSTSTRHRSTYLYIEIYNSLWRCVTETISSIISGTCCLDLQCQSINNNRSLSHKKSSQCKNHKSRKSPIPNHWNSWKHNQFLQLQTLAIQIHKSPIGLTIWPSSHTFNIPHTSINLPFTHKFTILYERVY